MLPGESSVPDVTDKLTAVRRQNTHEIIIKQLKDLILSGELKPGQKLPGERALSEKFGASRNSVRLALKLLEFINLLEIRPGSGVYVTCRSDVDDIFGSDQLLLLKRHPLMDLIEARKCFEPYIAALAARNATDQKIVEMEIDLNSMEKAIRESKHAFNQAARFHELLLESCNNIILKKIGRMLQKLSDESKRVSLLKNEHLQQSLIEHREILKAIKAGDPKAASRAMEKHLESVETHLHKEGLREKSSV